MVEGSSAESTPTRVMYQKLMPVQDASTLKAQILKPLAGCPDSKVQDLQLGSKYRDQLGFQATCSKLGTQDYGLIDYVAIFSEIYMHSPSSWIEVDEAHKAWKLLFPMKDYCTAAFEKGNVKDWAIFDGSDLPK